MGGDRYKKLLEEKRFPPDEKGQPRAPSAPPPRPNAGTPRGDTKGRDRSSSPTPKHCKKFLATGQCNGGNGCPGIQLHLAEVQFAEKKKELSGGVGGNAERRGDSPHPSKNQ